LLLKVQGCLQSQGASLGLNWSGSSMRKVRLGGFYRCDGATMMSLAALLCPPVMLTHSLVLCLVSSWSLNLCAGNNDAPSL